MEKPESGSIARRCLQENAHRQETKLTFSNPSALAIYTRIIALLHALKNYHKFQGHKKRRSASTMRKLPVQAYGLSHLICRSTGHSTR